MFLGLYVRARLFGSSLREKLSPQDGAVATEYALLLVLIALAIIVAAAALGVAISGKFSQAGNTISTGVP